ncbi:hypothetical protein Cgig2_022480 [Carnegiea gigantea]|uniref:F-box associated beta-propeller type 1 domain-containing protein n=1 Tax=Carnegiea gigantea TaxID=171969 RepID=A0A9Q1K9N3_9CARY|nr:hypothetical protein Cgig2_022480 [Carnegiea gigantea]
MPPMPAQRSYALGFEFDYSKIDHKRKAVGSISGPRPRIMGRRVYTKGVVHWVLERNESCNTSYSILTFNLATEVFAEMVVPKDINLESMDLTTLNKSGEEKLVVYHNDHICNVWDSTDSWRKLCTNHDGCEYATVLNAWENGEIVVSTSGGRLLSHNSNTDQQQINISLGHTSPLESMGPRIESLIFPDQYHGIVSDKRL